MFQLYVLWEEIITVGEHYSELSDQVTWCLSSDYHQGDMLSVSPPPAHTVVHISLLQLLSTWIMWAQWQTLQTSSRKGKFSQQSLAKVHRERIRLCFFPCYIFRLCDFALSLCYHSDGRSQTEVMWASINNSLILADVPKVSQIYVLSCSSLPQRWTAAIHFSQEKPV